MCMKSKLTYIVVLLALTFNIVHASVIAAEDHCVHESISEYLMEQSQDTDCGDLCDLHHLFHLTAIITSPITFPEKLLQREQPDTKLLRYHPPFQRSENKPPIA